MPCTSRAHHCWMPLTSRGRDAAQRSAVLRTGWTWHVAMGRHLSCGPVLNQNQHFMEWHFQVNVYHHIVGSILIIYQKTPSNSTKNPIKLHKIMKHILIHLAKSMDFPPFWHLATPVHFKKSPRHPWRCRRWPHCPVGARAVGAVGRGASDLGAMKSDERHPRWSVWMDIIKLLPSGNLT
jgi:hypothetical protein